VVTLLSYLYDGLHVVDEGAPGGVRTEIRFTELTTAALDQSVLALDGEVAIPDHQQLYEGWRRSFDLGNTGPYRETVASIVGRFQSIFLRREGR
jgi:hypothetical protein